MVLLFSLKQGDIASALHFKPILPSNAKWHPSFTLVFRSAPNTKNNISNRLSTASLQTIQEQIFNQFVHIHSKIIFRIHHIPKTKSDLQSPQNQRLPDLWKDLEFEYYIRVVLRLPQSDRVSSRTANIGPRTEPARVLCPPRFDVSARFKFKA